jgi:hypothetical protein
MRIKINYMMNYYEALMNFAETNLVNLKPNIEKIIRGLTGGFDSRLTVAVLSKICKKTSNTLGVLYFWSGYLIQM